MRYKVFISSFFKFAAAAGLRWWLRFFVFALLFGGCTVQFQLPPATVSNLPDGGKVDVLPDSIPAMYSTRPRFYWEQIEKSDSAYYFAVTDANRNGRWLDSMRWIPAGPFVTVGADTLATLGAVRDTAANLRALHRNVYQCEDYGAHVDTTDNSPKIQAAIDAAAANGGGIVKLTTPGVYAVASAGASCYTNYACIIMKDSIDFILGQGVTLKMADDQWNDTGTVRVVIMAVCDAENFSISGGKLDGNAPGQTTWTGGYEQAKAFGIQAYQCNSFEVRDMHIVNGLSNPINFHSCYDGEVVNMYSTGCGEGPEWQQCWDFDVRNYVLNDSTDVAVGDGFELAGCRKFNISGVNISENGLGAAIDLYGSTDIVVSGFFIQNWNGVGISYNNPAAFRPLNINISDGIIRGNKTQNGIQPNGDPGGSSTISNVVFDSLQFGIYMIDNAEGYTLAGDCVFKSNLVGVRMECNDTLYLKSSLFLKNTYGVQFDVHPTYTLPVLVASDCDFYENGSAFYYSGDGSNTFTPKFYLDGGRLLDNTSEITYSAIAPNDTTNWLYGDYLVGNQMKYGGYGKGDFEDTDHAFFITIDSSGHRQEMPLDSVQNYISNGGGGGGSMSSFLLDADSGTPETINDGDTITLSGGFGINTSVGATDELTVSVDTSQMATINALQDTAAAIRGDIPALDGNGIFDAANDGGTIPTLFNAQITDEFTLTDGTNDLFSINSNNGHTAIGKGANESSQYSLNITEVMNYNSGSFGGLLITNSYNHNANSSGGLVGLLANPTVSGTHVPSYVYGASISPSVSGSANLTTVQGIRARPIHSGSATITSMSAVHAQLFETGSGDVVIGYGLNVDNNSGTFSSVHGVNINDQTATGNVYGVSSGISSGTGKYNIYASGTAANYFNGDTEFGNAIKDKDGDTGTAGQLLSSTGSQTDWVDPPAAPQYAMSYIRGGANSSIAAGTPEQFNGTTTGTVDTVAATSNFTVQSDGEIEWNGANNSILEITADFSFYMSTSVAIIYFYIAKNGVVESTSRITQRSGQTFREGGTINWIDTDADSGDVYGVYVDFFSGTLGITSEDIRIKVKQIE